jgi:hypothetical protein
MRTRPIDILLVYPRPTKDSPIKLAPLSIMYPALYFKSQGLKVELFDQRFDLEDDLERLITDAKMIGVSAMTGYQSGQAADILIKAKKTNPEILAGVGGHHARILPEQVMAEPFVDKVWTGNYGESLSLYDDQLLKHFLRTDMHYMTSTGCPFGCRFCALSRAWEPKPIQSIDKELRQLHKVIGFSYVSFADPNMNHYLYKKDGKHIPIDNVKRIREIGDILRDLQVRWEANLRSPTLTEEMVEALVYANCTEIEIGCESGNDEILRKIVRKGHGVEAIKRAVTNTRGSGISVMYSFIAFMPGETVDHVKETMDLIDWIVETDPLARVSIFNYTPYPGTPMYEDAVAGRYGYPKFIPPTTMKGWSQLSAMQSPLYWITGLNFRMDNTRKNFPGEDWRLIEPYVALAKEKWRTRDIFDFPCDDVAGLIEAQVKKFDHQRASIASRRQGEGLPAER